MYYSSRQLYDILEIPSPHEGQGTLVDHISVDSRNILDPYTCLFVAIKGKHTDGHKYLDDAFAQGVRHFIIQKSASVYQRKDAFYYPVDDQISALQKIAKHHRTSSEATVLAIVGSNGKTIIKEWLTQCLETKKSIYRSPLSYNSQLGVALSLCAIPDNIEQSIIEAGISQTGEMERLAHMVLPDEGLFTHLGDAHSAGFPDIESKLREKIKMFAHCETIYYSSKNTTVKSEIEHVYKDKNLVSWGDQKRDALQIIDLKHDHNITIAFCEHQEETFNFELPFSDPASVENCLHIINYLLHQNWSFDNVQDCILSLKALPLRLEIVRGINGCEILNDSYSADLHSFKNALEFLDVHAKSKSRTVILTEFFQLKENLGQLIQKIAQLLVNYKIARVITIGENITSLTDYLPEDIHVETCFASEEIANLHFKNEAILIKGARQYALEKVANYLQDYSHKAQLEINLSALEHNVNSYKSYLLEDTKIMAVLKAGAYGSGSISVARFLEKKGVEYFVVAMIDEGIELRNHGIRSNILVLNPDLENVEKLFKYNLEPEIYSLEQLHKITSYAKLTQSKVSVHINLDTGMHRLGILQEEISALNTFLSESKYVFVASVFSHLAGSEDKVHDDFSHQQYADFMALADSLVIHQKEKPLRHILNSSGIIRFPQYQLDMVRLGLGLYGIDISKEAKTKLKKVHCLKAFILQTKKVKKGESIGYSRKYIAQNDMRIGILNIGYADGLPRILSGGNYSFALRSQPVPLVGNISMDLTNIDITHISDAKAGDEVEIFGDFALIEKLAETARTISYEILSNISDRVKRITYLE